MTLELTSIRPSVIQEDTFYRLNDYRGFRHVAIHRYGFELYPERIRELVKELPTCYANLSRDLECFYQYLQTLERSL
jgi:uncharacterized protein YutE (UPF0331/DUF86 family)